MIILQTLTKSRSLFRLVSCKKYSTSFPGKMQNVFIRYPSDSPTFNVSFHYKNEAFGIDKDINLVRQTQEEVGVFLARLTTKVEALMEKCVEKKQKKKMRKDKAAIAQSGLPLAVGLPQTDVGLPPITVTVNMLKSGKIVSLEEVCKSLLESGEMLTLALNGRTYNVVINAPRIDSFKLPSSMLSGFPVYPVNIAGEFYEIVDCQFVWSTSSDKNKWNKVGSGFMYTPSTAEIGCFLKVECVPKRGHETGQEVSTTSKCFVEAGPGICPFETRHKFTAERAEGESFRVTTYNILAGMYSDTDVAKEELFQHCPAYALNIDYRKQLFIKEILGYNSDIVCLQEVDDHIYEGDLQPVLSTVGYSGVYVKKGHTVREGLACLVNTKRFRIIESQSSVLCAEVNTSPHYKPIWEKIKDNQPLLERLQGKSTTTQAVILQSVENPNNWLVVGNTHLYFHPDADHIRLMQSGLSMHYLENVTRSVAEKNPGACISLLFCGDFNSTPSDGVYQFMTSGHIADDVVDWKSNPKEAISNLSLTQSFKLESACGTPQYTNFTEGFAACIDYIFYQTDHLKVKQVIPFYSEEELKRYVALPNVVFPSDHVALVADLSFKST